MAKHHSNLTEGLREGDLSNLVLPLISIDEYTSKISPKEAIVVGFYVRDEAAAKDLNRFLQKSPLPLLGTDVSPAPDRHGYFMVFVEFLSNDRMAENFNSLLEEMTSLVDIDEWAMRVRNHKHLIDFSEDNLDKVLKDLKHADQHQDIMEFLGTTGLRRAEIEGDLLLIEGNGERLVFQILDFGGSAKLLAEHNLDTGLRFDLRSIAKSNRIARVLGENWYATLIGTRLLLHSDADPRALLVAM